MHLGKDEAAKLEGMMIASRMFLQAIADYVREAVPDEHRREFMLKIGTAMAELIDISRAIYDEHPQLNPHPPAPEVKPQGIPPMDKKG